MFGRQKSGSVVCACGRLVGVQDDRCLNCGRWNPGLWGFAPALRRFGNDFGFIEGVTTACVLLFVAELGVSVMFFGGIGAGGLLGFLSPTPDAVVLFGGAGAFPVFQLGHWWTLLSAGWLHGSLLHIIFNMMAIRQIGPACADLYGPGRTIIVYVLSSVVAFLSELVRRVFFRANPGHRRRGADARRVWFVVRADRRHPLLRRAKRQPPH